MAFLTAASWLPATASPGFCTLADPTLLPLHLLSDVAIGLAYLSIPAALVVVLARRRDLAYPWLIGLFALFIVACGATHLMHAWALFSPEPALEGAIKAVTAAISVAVAITLWPVLPKLLALRSPAALAREVEIRRAAEERARASEARTAAFIAHLAEALFVVQVEPDGTMRIETVNPAFERLFGLHMADIAGMPAEQAVPEAVRARILPFWREAAAHGETQDYEVTADLPGGRRSWQTVLVPMRGPDGRVESLLGSARDVTATRRLQAGLVQSARLATVGTMCAGLAHETSQPLNTAMLWLRRLRAGLPPLSADHQAAVMRAASVVEEQLRRAGDLVGRIRALAGEEPRDAEVFDAAATAAAAMRMATAQFAGEGISFTLDAVPGPMPVRGSAARLEQAILHLLTNARDAVQEHRRRSPDAPAWIELRLRQDEGRVVIETCDSGTGVPETLGETIFAPFFTTKEPGRGAGLGLAFAAGVARAMGGGIEAWNHARGGACFRMEIAPALAAAPPSAVPA
jgi:PAS domain S-box-containing protein